MTYPTVFGNLTAGNQPASLFDTMFNIAGQQGNIPCTASGTNAITCTPSTNYYLPAAYTIAQIVSFKATATSTGSVTIQIAGLSFVKLYTAAGVQAASGDVVINTHYAVQYWADLDGGNGGFIILNASVTAIASPTASSFTKLKLITSSDTTLTPTATAVVLQNGSGGTVRLTSVAPAVTSTASVGTANGIRSAVANDTWYSFWFIYNPNAALSSTNPGGWLDTSFTSPALPSGYTYSARFGAFITNGSAKLHRILQYGRRAQYVVSASTTTVVPNIVNGVQGTWSATSPTLTAVSIAGVVPPTASRIFLLPASFYMAGGQSTLLVAPTTAYGGTNMGPQGSAGNAWPCSINDAATDSSISGFDFILEDTTIAVAANGAGGAVSCLGWEDNL